MDALTMASRCLNIMDNIIQSTGLVACQQTYYYISECPLELRGCRLLSDYENRFSTCAATFTKSHVILNIKDNRGTKVTMTHRIHFEKNQYFLFKPTVQNNENAIPITIPIPRKALPIFHNNPRAYESHHCL